MLKKAFIPGPEKVHEVPDDLLGPKIRNLLMLEDDVDTACLLKEYLETANFKVTIVPSGVEGLKHIMATSFDAILCDMLMPNLPGDMFYLAVQRIKPELCKRFIFMTGHSADPKWDAFVRKVGGVMLFKPFEMQMLTAAIERTIEKAEKAEAPEVVI
ncbi:MAG TPA: response regulator [Methylomirabilota bacterium]|nr:response regulator [Methylomirabilota bacterium]